MQPFLVDIFPEGWIHGRVVRSRVPRGRLARIDVPSLPPGYVAVQAKDIPGDPCGAMPYLALDRVSYAGEPVLLLAGPDPERLSELAGAVRIEVEEEPAPPAAEAVRAERITRGDIRAAFQSAARIVECEYRVEGLGHPQPPAQGAVAVWEKGSLLVYSDAAADLRARLARLLKLPVARVRVAACRPAAPEGEPDILAAGHAALLARAAGRPVRLVRNPAEDPDCVPRSPPARIRHRTALDEEGGPLGFEVELELDAGAYQTCARQALLDAALTACGAYRLPAVDVRASLVQTPRVPAAVFHGPGAAQAFFAAELHASRLAEVAGMDPCTWKEHHLLQAGDVLLNGVRLKGPAGSRRVLEEVVRASDFRRRHAAYELMRQRRRRLPLPPDPLRGIGLAVCYQAGGPTGKTAGRPPAVRRPSPAGGRRPLPAGAEGGALRGSGASAGDGCSAAVFGARSPGEGRPGCAWAGTAVDLEVDPVSLQGTCRGIWVAIDAGRIADPLQARLQVEGAVLRSLGCVSAGGWVPGFLDAPPIEVLFLEPAAPAKAARAREGSTELGDLPFLGLFPAYAAALAQATGWYVDQIPALPESIQTFLELD